MNHLTGGYLEVRELVVEYARPENTLKVVDHVDLIAEPNEIVALVGPSGCGKSTLVHAIAGFVASTWEAFESTENWWQDHPRRAGLSFKT